ncbi:hypothetical protein SAY87_001272 [Trapa incisa]|uniref:BHLH domain-containing protein n=1 Tax=Trapa incisa TaxID=236973 RepID=A0AAN7JAC1_9MYRT|nr:hypothetical protein SAY87_001272 [Trapa incisa]
MPSSPPPGIIPSLEETTPFLNDSSIEDLGDLWPLLDDQESLVTQPTPSSIDLIGAQSLERQDTTLLAEPSFLGHGLLFAETTVGDGLMEREENAGCPAREAEEGPSWRTRTRGREPDKQGMDGEESSVVKKQDHNAKERVRRKKLNASCLALGELLPPSRRSKKRWSVPMIIDRVVEYIPELRQEIEDLTLKKEKMIVRKAEAACSDRLESSSPIMVSVHDVRSREELIVQISMKKKKKKNRREDGGEDDGVVPLLSNFEIEGISVLSASLLDLGEDQACYHFHIQMSGCSYGTDQVAILKAKVISWLMGTRTS